MFFSKEIVKIQKPFNRKTLTYLEIFFIFFFSALPLFTEHYFQQNVYFSYAGAYRLFIGHLPYIDFGMPMGIGFWLIPAFVFTILGPTVFNLVVAQFVVNTIFVYVVIKILKIFNVDQNIRLISVFFLCFVYIPLNYWPWYNNTVIFFQIISLFFLLNAIGKQSSKAIIKYLNIILAGFFSFMCVITKQDAGAMNLAIALFLLIFYSIVHRKLSLILIYILVTTGFIASYFLFFSEFRIDYWFNYGQYPHFSRLSLHDLLKDLFFESKWIKLYLIISVVLFVFNWKRPKKLFSKDSYWTIVFLLFTMAILVESAIFQVTSYNPPNSNIFFHAFGMAFIGHHLSLRRNGTIGRFIPVLAITTILFLYPENYWLPTKKLINTIFPHSMKPPPANVVSKDNYYPVDSIQEEQPLRFAVDKNLKSVSKIKLPTDLIKGIKKLKDHTVFEEKGNPVVLNMSELTFLPFELGYTPLQSTFQPLCYHVGVCMFEKEISYFKDHVENEKYDVIIFETIPYWDNYFPYPVRDIITKKYQLFDRFRGPKGFKNTHIEVYVKKTNDQAQQD